MKVQFPNVIKITKNAAILLWAGAKVFKVDAIIALVAIGRILNLLVVVSRRSINGRSRSSTIRLRFRKSNTPEQDEKENRFISEIKKPGLLTLPGSQTLNKT